MTEAERERIDRDLMKVLESSDHLKNERVRERMKFARVGPLPHTIPSSPRQVKQKLERDLLKDLNAKVQKQAADLKTAQAEAHKQKEKLRKARAKIERAEAQRLIEEELEKKVHAQKIFQVREVAQAKEEEQLNGKLAKDLEKVEKARARAAQDLKDRQEQQEKMLSEAQKKHAALLREDRKEKLRKIQEERGRSEQHQKAVLKEQVRGFVVGHGLLCSFLTSQHPEPCRSKPSRPPPSCVSTGSMRAIASRKSVSRQRRLRRSANGKRRLGGWIRMSRKLKKPPKSATRSCTRNT